MVDSRRSTRPYRRARAELKAKRKPCHICGRAIDYSLPPDDPMSFVADHLVPLAQGGHYMATTNLDAAHRLCNGRRGTRDARDVVPLPQPSRDW